MRNPNLLRDLIRAFETNARDVLSQSKWIGADLFDRAFTVSLVDAHRAAGADAVRVQEHHDIPDHPLLRPGIFDPAPAHRPDALHFFQPAGIALDNVEDSLAEFCDELFSVSRPDAFDHA